MNNKNSEVINEYKVLNKLRKDNKKRLMTNNAKRSLNYDGRRYLGRTKTGKEIWITMRFNRKTMALSLNCNGNIADLLENEAELSTKRIVQRLGNKKPDVNQAMFLNRRNEGGEVTSNTINYMMKLMSAVSLKDSASHIDKKCTKMLFRIVANAVFEGDASKDNGYRWIDIVENWEFPEDIPIATNLDGEKIYRSSNYFDVNNFPIG
jgi:hypothetical protein